MNLLALLFLCAALSCRMSGSKQEGLSSSSSHQVALSPCYIGVCLPRKKEALLQVHNVSSSFSSLNSLTFLSSLPHSLLSLFCSCFWTLFLCLLQIPPTEFRDVQTDCPLSDLDQPAEEGLKLHSKSRCLKCRLSTSHVCQLPEDACTESMQGDENSLKQSSSEERVAVRKEALKLVSKLSGDIAAKATKQGLKMYSGVCAFKWFV